MLTFSIQDYNEFQNDTKYLENNEFKIFLNYENMAENKISKYVEYLNNDSLELSPDIRDHSM
jgi:hypothetical protein